MVYPTFSLKKMSINIKGKNWKKGAREVLTKILITNKVYVMNYVAHKISFNKDSNNTQHTIEYCKKKK